jgi:hypothetical protein
VVGHFVQRQALDNFSLQTHNKMGRGKDGLWIIKGLIFKPFKIVTVLERRGSGIFHPVNDCTFDREQLFPRTGKGIDRQYSFLYVHGEYIALLRARESYNGYYYFVVVKESKGVIFLYF